MNSNPNDLETTAQHTMTNAASLHQVKNILVSELPGEPFQ